MIATEIRDELKKLNAALTQPMLELPCQHPPEQRTDSSPSARFWKCHGCGFIYDSEK